MPIVVDEKVSILGRAAGKSRRANPGWKGALAGVAKLQSLCWVRCHAVAGCPSIWYRPSHFPGPLTRLAARASHAPQRLPR